MKRTAIPAEGAQSGLLQKPRAVKMRTEVEEAKRMVTTQPEEETVLLKIRRGLTKTDLPLEIGNVQCRLGGVTDQIRHLEDVTVQIRRPKGVTAQIHLRKGNARLTQPAEETCLLKIRRGLEKTDLPLEIGTGSVQYHPRGVTGQGLQKGGSVQSRHRDGEIAAGLLIEDVGSY